MKQHKLTAKAVALLTGAVLCAGMITTNTVTPATQVEAATKKTATKNTTNSALNQALKGVFDANFYANKYPDVKNAYGTDSAKLWNHFITHGITEGRMANAKFDPKAYIAAYADIKAYCNGDYRKAYEHYVNHGMKENRTLTTFEAINAQKAPAPAPTQESSSSSSDSGSDNNNDDHKTSSEREIGYGLTTILTADDINNADITIMKNAFGYGAYLNGNLISSTPFFRFDEDNAYYVSTMDVNVYNISDVTGLPIWGTDIVTYTDTGWMSHTTDSTHYTNGQEVRTSPWAASESIDWRGTGNTPYFVAFGFGEYDNNHVEVGVMTYSPFTGHVDATETSVITNMPWNAYTANSWNNFPWYLFIQ